jgi:arsenate reductase
MSTLPNVLFLCTGNSCRSQMAQGFAQSLIPHAVNAFSAGTQPQGLNPLAVAAMAEVGIDISRNPSQRPQDIPVNFDVVVTVCDHAHETCPVFSGAPRIIHHAFEDPPRLARNAASKEEAFAHYQRVRDEIKAYIVSLPQVLAAKNK